MSELDGLQRDVLRVCVRFGIGEPELFERLPIFKASDRTAKSVLVELEQEHGLIRQATLFSNRTCYELTQRFSEQFDSDGLDEKPLTRGAKKRALAMLQLCLSESPATRWPLKAADFELPQLRDIASAFSKQTRVRDYYLATRPEGTAIGFLRIDGGAEHRWERLLQKLKRDCLKPDHQDLIRRTASSLEFAVVTPFTRKAEIIRDAILRHTLFDGLAIHTYSLPDLAQFRSS